MKVELHFSGVNPEPSWREFIAAQLCELNNLASIASARVRLERQREWGSKAAFRVVTRLEVPGLDFHSEGCDFTWQAALLKVKRDLERQIRSRHARRADRWKTNLQLGRAPGRMAGLASVRAGGKAPCSSSP